MTETVQALVPLLEYQQGRAHLFPSLESLRWYLKRHRAALIEAEALVMVAGRLLASPEPFDGYVLRAGKDAARKAVA